MSRSDEKQGPFASALGAIRFGRGDAATEERELDDELQFHLETSEQELRAAGWDPAEARREAERRFGDLRSWREACRRVDRRRRGRARLREAFVGLGLDLKQAWRQVAKAPGFALAAILTLGLGIGFTTAIFSLVDGILLRPLPYDEPERLVRLYSSNEERGWSRFGVSPQDFVDWRDQTMTGDESAVFSEMAMYRFWEANSVLGGTAYRLQVLNTWESLFPILGAEPALGSLLEPLPPTDAGEPPSFADADGAFDAVLSHRFWQRDLGGDPEVLGSKLILDGRAYRVIGVLEEGFEYPNADADVYTRLSRRPEEVGTRSDHYLSAIARLAEGRTAEAARVRLDTVTRRLEEAYPDTNEGWRAVVVPLHEWVVGDARRSLLLLWAAVGCVLLVACSNVAHLFLVRGEARRRELTTRAALGAGRRRLLRQLLTESCFVALLGGVVGVGLAHSVVALLPRLAAESLPRLEAVSVDGGVLLFALGVSVLTGLLFGIVPAWRCGGLGARRGAEVLRGVRSDGGGSPGSRFTSGLVVAEVVLAVVLLVAAGLVLRSFQGLLAQDVGFDPEGVVTFRLSPPMDFSFYDAETPEEMADAYRSQRQRQADLFAELLDRLRAAPGVAAAGAANVLPLSGNAWADDLRRPGDPEPEPVFTRVITPGYFRTLGIPLLGGRDVELRDRDGTAWINRAAVSRLYPDVEPAEMVGRRLVLGHGEVPFWDGEVRVEGVVGDVRASLEEPAAPLVYLPMSGATSGFGGNWAMSVLLRAEAGADPAALLGAARKVASEVAPRLPVFDAATLESRRRRGAADERLTSWLLGLFGLSALLLASVGLYGSLAYTVGRGRHAIGVRLALGAEPREVVVHWLGKGLRLALLGVGLGWLASLAGSRLLESQLYGVEATDPWIFASAAGTLLAAALVASWVPARRASRVDPSEVLRAE